MCYLRVQHGQRFRRSRRWPDDRGVPFATRSRSSATKASILVASAKQHKDDVTQQLLRACPSVKAHSLSVEVQKKVRVMRTERPLRSTNGAIYIHTRFGGTFLMI